MTTLVTAFYDIGRKNWKNFERNVSDYIESFKTFLDYDNKMIIFIDDRYYNQFMEVFNKSLYRDNKQVFLIDERWIKENIWSFSRLARETDIMQSEGYRSKIPHRITNNYPENICPEYTILTHSKIDFVNYAAEISCLPDDYYAWVDFGYFFDKQTSEFLPNGKFDDSKLNKETVNICCINPIAEEDKDILYTLSNAPEKIGAYFFYGHKNKLKEFQQLCHKWLIKFQEMGIADDEQALWLQCYFEKPELFTTHIFGKWHKALKEFSCG